MCFFIGIGTAFTGYVIQQNFAAQWIAVEAKDAMNAIGVGALFNVLNFGQMYGWHIAVMPAILVVLVAWHLLLVRFRGVVRPYETENLVQKLIENVVVPDPSKRKEVQP